MGRTLVIAEHDGITLNRSTYKCVSCAASFESDGIDVAVFAENGESLTQAAATIKGVSKVLRIDHPANATSLATTLAPQIVALSEDYTHLFGPSTTFGKDVMPRVAGLLGVGQLSDIMAAESSYRFKRPIYGGNAIVTVEASANRVLVATVRTASYADAENSGTASIETRALNAALPDYTRYIELRSERSDRPDLQTAARVISGGRALGSAEKFELIYELAAALGAAVGASRAAVDSGYASNDLQVGQTGKIIAPELYIAVGISGAIQHLTGIKDAKTIVAINSDGEAPIFEVADIALVADLFEALPELTEALRSASDRGG